MAPTTKFGGILPSRNYRQLIGEIGLKFRHATCNRGCIRWSANDYCKQFISVCGGTWISHGNAPYTRIDPHLGRSISEDAGFSDLSIGAAAGRYHLENGNDGVHRAEYCSLYQSI